MRCARFMHYTLLNSHLRSFFLGYEPHIAHLIHAQSMDESVLPVENPVSVGVRHSAGIAEAAENVEDTEFLIDYESAADTFERDLWNGDIASRPRMHAVISIDSAFKPCTRYASGATTYLS